MKPDSEGLHKIANTENSDRIADIVFIHGLGGSSHSTWCYSKEGKPDYFFWPKELGNDLPKCGIWSIGYPAGFTELGRPGMIIEKRAGNISFKLTNANLGDRPIIFITHSMGGLIVKSLITESSLHPDLNRKRLVSATKGIVFCATPHRGSPFADAARILGIFFGGTQKHVQQMQANSDEIDLLNGKFIEWHRHNPIPVDSYAENIGLFRTRWFRRALPLGLVVPRASANTAIPGYSLHDVDDDHLTIVKPRNRHHDVYAGVLQFLMPILTNIPPLTSENKIHNDATDPSSNISKVSPYNDIEKRPTHDPNTMELAFAHIQLEKENKCSIVSVCLTSDEPTQLIETIKDWRAKLTRSPLISSTSREKIKDLSLTELFNTPETRVQLLNLITKVTFSAYAYYYRPTDNLNLTSNEIENHFVITPLIHRLSKKTERVTVIHSEKINLTSAIGAASATISTQFKRHISLPKIKTISEYGSRELIELSEFIAHTLALHIHSPDDKDQTTLFNHIRTRLRFAENVITGEKHTRDKNPLD